MRVKYSSNWMGPVSLEWIKKNGDHWAAGRIDVYGDGVPEYEEINLPMMKIQDWNNFSRWLDALATPEVWSLDDLVNVYEKYNSKITWWKQ